MRIAVLSDIHGNLAALECVLEDIDKWAPDSVVVNGDIVNRGPRPLACWALIKARRDEKGWLLVKGNHEEYVAEHRSPNGESTAEDRLHRGSHWTFARLGRENVDELAALPDMERIRAGEGGEVRFLHASMRGNRDGIYPDTDDETLEAQITPAPRLFATAHTHRPLLRWWRNTLVVNSGSVGLPFDRDRRAAYARLVYREGKWTAKIRRLDYDWERGWNAYEESGYLEGGGPLSRLHRVEFRDAVSHLHIFSPLYLESVLAGELSLTEAVRTYIEKYINVAPL